MMMKIYSKLTCGVLLVASLTSISCKKILDVEPKDKLDVIQTYRNVYDADAAVIGIYGKFMNLAKQYVVLNELRADLMDVTANSDQYLKQVTTSNVTEDNPYADPRPFYEVILNCNDALKNFDVMLRDNKMTVAEYNTRYSDIGAIRSFVYLQLGIHFGRIPYVTDPISNINDLKDESKFPKLTFDQLLDKLITFTDALPYKEMYPTGTSLITTVDTYATEKFFINKNCLLGDLHLWKNDYRTAAEYYKRVLSLYDADGNINIAFYRYKLTASDVQNNNDNRVSYTRFREQDINQLVDNNNQGWRSIFGRAQTDAFFNHEWIWVLPFDKSFQPQNPFVELFSNQGGKYQVTASQSAIDRWNSQTQMNGFPYDQRGRFTVRAVSGQPVIMKYIYRYQDPTTLGLPINPLEKGGYWYLYRAATLFLRYAEAANRDNQDKVAYAFLNDGIKNTFDTNPANSDQTNKQATFLPFPYNFDARMGTIPYFRDPWHNSSGVRTRGYLKPNTIDSARFFDMSVPGNPKKAVTDRQGLILHMENKIINEAALELAYEGNRWPDLVRIARRRNDPAYLADKIYDKLSKDGNPDAAMVRGKLMDPNNWYLPFKWK
ncbi:MAG: RagB/SusD family nutrient uptake outer membrane protein [Candidatus Pedobacter colombiensis]|uniref:RagB/SusD family nutrient uptake outer membrane protein n=1 Tax=Candidatus Pedobacter colombiensis TaxID=3121371 RepID=A0AAJ6B855_9SPHI|nr:RagB/SusD family nutrient uptake outer membrane protein [Pedobacter sp.]WEK20176.1 MAG: RagB/SusD family nutrient uptake outer membrane protein [Pedobacter sp.]